MGRHFEQQQNIVSESIQGHLRVSHHWRSASVGEYSRVSEGIQDHSRLSDYLTPFEICKYLRVSESIPDHLPQTVKYLETKQSCS